MLECFIFLLLLSTAAMFFAVRGSKVEKGLDAVSMYRVAACLVVGSILSGSISLFAVLWALHSPSPDFSNLDIYVDILGVLVTVLMGWNILSVVDIKKRVEKIDVITEDFQHVVLGILQLNIKSFLMTGEKSRLLDNCFLSLKEIKRCSNDETSRLAIEEIMNLLHGIGEKMQNDPDAFLYRGKKNEYLHILRHVDNKYSKELLSLIKKLKEKDVELPSGLNIFNGAEGRTQETSLGGETVSLVAQGVET
jgi:hypothetical protein